MTTLRLPPTEAVPMPVVVASAAPPVPAAEPFPAPTVPSPQVPTVPHGRPTRDAHTAAAVGAQTTRPTDAVPAPEHEASGGSTTPPPTEPAPMPTVESSAGGEPGRGQGSTDTQNVVAAADSQRVSQARNASDAQEVRGLADPLLYLAAASLDDLERTRIAAENRLRQLTRDEEDADGEERGAGLPEDDPLVRAQAALVEGLARLEHESELALKRRLRRHPLHGWIKSTVGVGEKQAARLLAAVGDPYWHPETLNEDGSVRHPAGPRTVSQLWAYAGYKVVPAGQGTAGTHWVSASGPQDTPTDQMMPDARVRAVGGGLAGDGDPGHLIDDTHKVLAGVAVRRRKGQRANWSSVAKMRAYLIAQSCTKQARSPYRAVYDKRRAHTAVTRPGWTPGHSHNDALRVVAKEILKDLWRAAREVHEQAGGQGSVDKQLSDQRYRDAQT